MLKKVATFTLALPLMAGGLCMAEDRMPAKTEVTKTTETMKAEDAGMHARMSSFMKKDIHNAEGKDIGDIKDVVLDGSANRISYVVVSYGGFMGMGDKLFAVPISAFEFRHDGDKDDAKNKLDLENQKVYLTIAEEQLKNAPQSFDDKKWPDMADPKFRGEVDAYYMKHRAAKGVDTRMNNMADKAAGGTDAGGVADRMGEKMAKTGPTDSKGLLWVRRASKFVGADVHNKANEDVGKITDLVFNTHTGQIHYAVLSYGGMLGMGDKLFAVPVGALATKADDDKIVLDVTKDQLKNTQGFDKNNWPDFANADWRKGVDSSFQKRQTEVKTDPTPMD